jgi:hypothetical protein
VPSRVAAYGYHTTPASSASCGRLRMVQGSRWTPRPEGRVLPRAEEL